MGIRRGGHDPTSELMMTILTQNSADVERGGARSWRSAGPIRERARSKHTSPAPAGAGWGCPTASPPDWAAVEVAPLPELVETIRPGGLGEPEGARIKATLRAIREARGDYSLEFLGEMSALDAREWLTGINGIGKKTASVVAALLRSGCRSCPVDRHVERVAHRVGLVAAEGHRGRGPRLLPGHAGARRDARGPRQPDPARPPRLSRPQPDHALPAPSGGAASSTRRRPDKQYTPSLIGARRAMGSYPRVRAQVNIGATVLGRSQRGDCRAA